MAEALHTGGMRPDKRRRATMRVATTRQVLAGLAQGKGRSAVTDGGSTRTATNDLLVPAQINHFMCWNPRHVAIRDTLSKIISPTDTARCKEPGSANQQPQAAARSDLVRAGLLLNLGMKDKLRLNTAGRRLGPWNFFPAATLASSMSPIPHQW